MRLETLNNSKLCHFGTAPNRNGRPKWCQRKRGPQLKWVLTSFKTVVTRKLWEIYEVASFSENSGEMRFLNSWSQRRKGKEWYLVLNPLYPHRSSENCVELNWQKTPRYRREHFQGHLQEVVMDFFQSWDKHLIRKCSENWSMPPPPPLSLPRKGPLTLLQGGGSMGDGSLPPAP